MRKKKRSQKAVADETYLPKPRIIPNKPGVDNGFRAPYEPQQYINYPFNQYETLPEVVVHSKTKGKYETLPNINVSSKKKSPIQQTVESSAIQMYNPDTKRMKSTANPGQTKRQIKEATSNIKGDSLKDSIKELTAMTQFAPIPLISIPSAIINSGIGANDMIEARKRGDVLNENINGIGAMPWQYMIPGLVGKGIEAVSAAADLTDNFGLEEKKNGGWLDKYGDEINANEGHSSAPKEWIGEGYSNVGRDYSPAWGGQFEEGGSLSDSGPGDNIFANSVNKGKSFNEQWMNSPMYKQMLENSMGVNKNPFVFNQNRKDADILNRSRQHQLKNSQWGVGEKHPDNSEGTAAEAYSWKPWGVPLQGAPINPMSTKSKYPDTIPYVNFVKGKAGQGGDDLDSDAVHEFSHISDASGQLMPKSDLDLMAKYSDNSAKYAELEKKYGKNFADHERAADSEWHNYIKDPTETRARLNDFRMRAKEQGVYDPFTQAFDSKYFKNYKPISKDKDGSYFDPLYQLRDVYTDQEISDMLNKISKSNSNQTQTTAKYGGYIPQAQKGLSFLPQQDPEMMYRDRFNTQLNKDEQNLFAEWVAKESERQGRDIIMDKGAYDVQGFWKSGDYKKMDQDNHGTDTWKKPNHPTFSNQSKYHGIDGFYGGNWNPDGGYQPSKQTASSYGPSYYSRMFAEEPNRPEHLDASRYTSGVNRPSPLYYAMGGSLPGSVGFTYARTAGSAPSNGPYAKKTKASAQNGTEMSYYQHGLDWKPKSISRDGSNIRMAQLGFNIPGVTDFVMPRNASSSTAIVYNTAKGPTSTATTGQTKQNIAASTVDMGKAKKAERDAEAKRVAERKSAVATKDKGKPFTLPSGETKNYQDMNAREKMYVSGKALEQRGRFNENKEAWYDDFVNPINWITSAAGALGTAPYEAEQSNSNMPYLSAIANPLIGGILGFNPLGAVAKVPGKVAQSMESGLLSNTYKLNPWAFKPNETNWYRQVGKSAIDDAFNTGIVREAGEEVSPRMFQEFQDQLVRMQGSGMDAALASRRPASPFFGKGELFYPMGRKPTINKVTGKLSKNPAGKGSADYLIETALPNESFQPAYVKGMGLGVPTETGATAILKPDPSLRNLENFNIYKKDWLRGYKEVPTSKSLVSSIENVTLPKITPEQWKDMSGYLGRRQFVKGLQKEGLVGKEFNLGDVNYAARSTGKTDALTKLVLDRKHTGFRNVRGELPGGGVGQQDYSNYTFDMNRPGFGQSISEVDNMMKAGVDFTNPQSIAEYQATHIPLEDYGYRSTGEWSVPQYGFLFRNPRPVSGREYGNFQFKSAPNLNFESGNYKDWFKKYYEDLKYHRGDPNFSGGPSRKDNLQDVMFWTKSNEPSVSGATLVGPRGTKAFEIDKSFPFTDMKNFTSEQSENLKNYIQEYNKQYNTGWRGQYKQGGVVKDNNGYWNPNNWGKVVEIDSPDITMEGVYEPLIGESKQTGEKKIMLPGKNYKFANTKQVIERPIAKSGIRQEQKGLQNLEDLTNFTNYNKPTKGGWLNKYN
jgi:hypothetical protein